MTSWKEERDRLIKETMAFVEGVARKHPTAADIAKIAAAPPDIAQPEVLEAATAEVIAEPDQPGPPELMSGGDTNPVPDTPAKTEAQAAEAQALPRNDIYLSVLPATAAPEPILTGDLPEQQDLGSARADRPSPSERTAIVSRVAAFKALQEKMSAERAAFYEATQERIKSALRNEADGPSPIDPGTGDQRL